MAEISLHAICEQARRLLEQNDTERAIAVAQYILGYFPDNLETHRILGEAYLASRQFDQAEEAFARVVNADPESIPALVGLGMTYERRGKLEQAVSEFERALEIKPDMPELRSQLLRLYTDAWGSEGAQLRLSRAGLARLYAKGHMLPQAIQEFRSVIAEHPERFDARVGLAEALWRDGQESPALAACDDIIRERNDVLKANLLLGYIKLASGNPDGSTYWNIAQQLDPYQGVARAMFATLPSVDDPQTTLQEWDEQLWQEQRMREAEALRARETEEQQAYAESLPATEHDMETTSEDEEGVAAGSWMQTVELQHDESHATAGVKSELSQTDDAFLASLLAFKGLDTDELADVMGDPVQSAPDVTGDLGIQPFSIDDLRIDQSDISLSIPQESALATGQEQAEQFDMPDVEAFSLDTLGLSEEELSALNEIASPAPTDLSDQVELSSDQAELPADDNILSEPFTLEGLELDEEFDVTEKDTLGSSSLDEISDLSNEVADVEPFDPSLGIMPTEDVLSDDFVSDEKGRLESNTLQGFQQFSLDDLDLNAADITDEVAHLDDGALPPSLQPFSLDDLGDIDIPPVPPSSVSDSSTSTFLINDDSDEDSQEPFAFGWQQPVSKPTTDFLRDTDESAGKEEDQSIFAKLRQRRQEVPDAADDAPLPPMSIDDDEGSAFFSDDDVSLRDDDSETLAIASSEYVAGLADTGEELGQASVAEDAAFSQEELDSVEDPGMRVDEVTPGEEPVLTPFSLGDLGLSEDEIASLDIDSASDVPTEQKDEPTAQPDDLEYAVMDDEQKIRPLSLEELGLSAEEIASLDMMGAEPAASDALAEVTDTSAAEEEPALTPFSLGDLGLSEDEIASLGNEQLSTPDEAEASALFTSEDPDVSPFSLSDLGLEETASTDAASFGMPATDKDDTSEGFSGIQPFSLADLGLDEDLDSLGVESLEGENTSELGLTEDELAGLDLETFTDNRTPQLDELHPAPQGQFTNSGSFESGSDFALERLINLGRSQGFVDLNDIIEVVENPVEQPERIEEIGQALHLAGIEIRDGDEVINMDDIDDDIDHEYADDLATLEANVSDLDAAGNDPDLVPFSLEDLGLTDEEIASLGLDEGDQGENASSSPTMSPDTQDAPDLKPFSFEELGLSVDEIATLQNVAQSSEETTNVEHPPLADSESDDTATIQDDSGLKPFSLEELGLSADEIAALNAAASESSASAGDVGALREEVDVFDFSMIDEHRDEVAAPIQRTDPRQEEQPSPIAPEDTEFTPQPLEVLDDIWDVPPDQVPEPPPLPAPASSAAAPVSTPSDEPRDIRAATTTKATPERRETRAAPVTQKTERSAKPKSSKQPKSLDGFLPTGDETLDGYVRQIATEPDNEGLHLAVARLGAKIGQADLAIHQYKYLIKNKMLLDQVVDDILELIAESGEKLLLQRLHRLLGDAYSEQNRFRDAIEAYSWTFSN